MKPLRSTKTTYLLAARHRRRVDLRRKPILPRSLRRVAEQARTAQPAQESSDR